jgi:AraC family transcriptional activator of pobA
MRPRATQCAPGVNEPRFLARFRRPTAPVRGESPAHAYDVRRIDADCHGTMHSEDQLPNFEVSEFGRSGSAFVFDLVKLDGRGDIPRPFFHRHSYYHILWMTHAIGSHVLDFESYEIKPHSVFFISPGQVHSWTSSVPTTGYAINFSPEFFLQMYPRANDVAEFPFFHIANSDPVLYLSPTQNAELLPMLEELAQEFGDSTRPWRYDVVRSFMLILLTRLRRLHRPRDRESTLPKSYSLTKRFKLMIEQHYLEFESVQAYATALCVTDRRLNEAVKTTVGKTATQLIHERILLEAKRLLTQSELGISEIAYRLNFEDPAYFSRFFKKHVLATPGEFKKKFAAPDR